MKARMEMPGPAARLAIQQAVAPANFEASSRGICRSTGSYQYSGPLGERFSSFLVRQPGQACNEFYTLDVDFNLRDIENGDFMTTLRRSEERRVGKECRHGGAT